VTLLLLQEENRKKSSSKKKRDKRAAEMIDMLRVQQRMSTAKVSFEATQDELELVLGVFMRLVDL